MEALFCFLSRQNKKKTKYIYIAPFPLIVHGTLQKFTPPSFAVDSFEKSLKFKSNTDEHETSPYNFDPLSF